MTARLTCVAAVAAVAAILCTATVAVSSEPPFPLDPTFNPAGPTPGLVRMRLDNFPATASLVHLLSDGAALVGLGQIDPSLGYGNGHVAVAKFHVDGTLDTSFNPTGPTPGIVDVTATGLVDIDVDSQGRILVGGSHIVTRLLPDATPDPTFIATCIAPCIPGQGEQPPIAPTGSVYVPSRLYDLAIAADDSIIIESSNEINQTPMVMNVSKLTSTGDRDLAFNAAGPIPGLLTVEDYGPGHLLPQPDGSHILVALSQPPRLHRITATGTLDSSYGVGGVVYPPVTHSDEAIWSATADGAGQIILEVARSFPAEPGSLVRIHPDGSTDLTFGTAGRVELASLGAEWIDPYWVQADHRIIVEVRHPTSAALARLTADGHLDASFNPSSRTPGWLAINPYPDPIHHHYIYDLVETGNGTLLAAGDRPLTGYAPTDDVAEIYRFNGFPGAPQPIEPYPITSPPALPPPTPAPVPAIGAAATADKPAMRLDHP